jgi:hypothetical protein
MFFIIQKSSQQVVALTTSAAHTDVLRTGKWTMLQKCLHGIVQILQMGSRVLIL